MRIGRAKIAPDAKLILRLMLELYRGTGRAHVESAAIEGIKSSAGAGIAGRRPEPLSILSHKMHGHTMSGGRESLRCLAVWKGGPSMILKAEALSPAQKSVIEQILGRQILEAEAISLRAFAPPVLDQPERQAAAENLRRFIEETGNTRACVSDEECEAAFLEAIRSERPHYTPVS